MWPRTTTYNEVVKEHHRLDITRIYSHDEKHNLFAECVNDSSVNKFNNNIDYFRKSGTHN